MRLKCDGVKERGGHERVMGERDGKVTGEVGWCARKGWRRIEDLKTTKNDGEVKGRCDELKETEGHEQVMDE